MSGSIARCAAAALAFLLALQLGAAPAFASDVEKQRWQKQHREVVAELHASRAELAEARHAWGKARQREYPRGEAREALRERLAEAEERAKLAEQKMAEFDEKARRAGALPGWFRENEAAAPVPPAAK